MAANPGEFVQLFIRHERRVFAYLMTVLGNAADAEDVLQQTCVVLWSKFDEFEAGSDFAAWAIRTAYLTARNHLRSKSRSRVCFSQAMFEAVAQQAATQPAQVDDVHDALGECLERLPAEDRDMIRQRYELDASVPSIADRLGRSVHVVYRALSRVHTDLFQCVTKRLAAGK
ncbi:MAG: sigma-70 family RNA polymerase sigma factor [Phycisphaeraceae bacterium]